MITSQDRLQPMDERRLTHQGARHSTVDHGYPSVGVFLLLHLWVLPSRWLISLWRSPSSLSLVRGWPLGANGSLQTERETRHSFIKDMSHGHDFLDESLVGVCRHSVRELHPTSVSRMKTQYVESLVVEVDVR
jgi:hypothetical protein